MSLGKPKKRTKMQAYGPIIGLLLAGSFGVLSWFLAPEIDKILARSLPNFREMKADQLRIATTVIMFVIFVLLASLIVAAAAPRKKSMVNERGLVKDRAEMIKEKKLTKIRRQQMNKMNKG
jgi:hypothetical protein